MDRKRKAKEQLEEDLLDELAPARHNRGRSSIVGSNQRMIRGAVEPGIVWDENGESVLDGERVAGDVARQIEYEHERLERYLDAAHQVSRLMEGAQRLMAENFHGLEADPELVMHAAKHLTPSSDPPESPGE